MRGIRSAAITAIAFVAVARSLAGAWLEDSAPRLRGSVSESARASLPLREERPTLITVTVQGTSAIVTWTDIPRTGVAYRIYRGLQPLSTEGALARAEYLGFVGDGVGVYIDQAPQGAFYYAVTAVIDGVEQRALVPDQSYTTFPVTILNANKELRVVSGLEAAYDRALKGIVLSWRAPANAGTAGEYVLYRNDVPILSEAIRSVSVPIATPSIYDSVYLDRALEEGNAYYYALLYRHNGKEDRVFIGGENATERPITAPQPSLRPVTTNAARPAETTNLVITNYVTNTVETETEPTAEVFTVNNLSATRIPDARGVEVAWTFNETVPTDYAFLVFRSARQPIYSAHALAANDLLISVVRPHEYLTGEGTYAYRDMSAPEGVSNYYAVLVANGTPFDRHAFLPNINYSIIPVVVPTITTSVSPSPKEEHDAVVEERAVAPPPPRLPEIEDEGYYERETRNAVTQLYYKDKFAECIVALEGLMERRALMNDRVYALAGMFLGRSYLGVRDYRKAIAAFNAVKDYSPEEANFWLDKAIKGLSESRIEERPQ